MAKKSFVSNVQKKQTPSVSHSRAHIIGSVSHSTPLIMDDEDEDEDICPVCESECTCRHKPDALDISTSAIPPSTPSTSSQIGDPSFAARAPKPHARSNPLDESSRKRREFAQTNNWEIRPRKKSVGVDGDSDLESAETTDVDDDGYIEDQENADDDDADDEDEDEDEDEDVQADVEGVAPDDHELDGDDASRIGVSFDGVPTGWSEDEEESSFDADLFFAALDDSSDDSSSSSGAPQEDGSDTASDADLTSMSSGDEDSTFFLMDVEPLLQLRRDGGEFELGLDLHNLSFEWDGQVILAESGHHFNANDNSSNSRPIVDVNMAGADDDQGQSTDEDVAFEDDTMLEDGDGDTTEDELVDSDGLPNSRAMMLFQWPNVDVVSAINPLSTVGHAGDYNGTQSHGSQTVRIALASMSARRDAPTPSPADILAGRFAMDDLDDIESDKHHSTSSLLRHRSGPLMGEFTPNTEGQERCAIINGQGGEAIPSPFPRRIRKAKSRRHRVPAVHNSDQTLSVFSGSPPTVPASTSPSVDEDPVQDSTTSDDSVTQVIDLDDVLHAAFFDAASTEYNHDTNAYDELTDRAGYVDDGTHIRSLSRWDRIPVATFRRTREVATLSAVEGSASDTGMSVYGGMGAMISSSMLARHDRKGKGQSSSRRSSGRGPGMVVISPVLMPIRDGDGTQFNKSSNRKGSNKKTRKELRKEKAMLKKNIIGKSLHQLHHHQHHPRHQLSKQKPRTSNATQRTNFFVGSNSYVPPLSL